MLADLRDFTIATYSSDFGTDARLIVFIFTESGGGSEGFDCTLLHPKATKVKPKTNTANGASPNPLKFIYILKMRESL